MLELAGGVVLIIVLGVGYLLCISGAPRTNPVDDHCNVPYPGPLSEHELQEFLAERED